MLPLAAIGVVALLVFPLPFWFLDVGIAANFAVSLLLLVRAVQLPRPERFTTLPTLLLFTTLFRLGLNVATTRGLLAYGQAPALVATFGNYAAGGSVVAGLTIFLILTVVQFLVIAKGAERVAEVAARFALDALPGKQLTIDAELRAGVLSALEARARRQDLQRESRLYGALDGAMKFVKGDAIAGIVITVLNLCVGFGLGVASLGLTVSEALVRYTVFTIGDGLVSQIPALLVATASGVVISRVSDEREVSLADDVARQLWGNRVSVVLCSVILLAVTFVPGFPILPFVLVSFGFLALLLIPRVADTIPVSPFLIVAPKTWRRRQVIIAATRVRMLMLSKWGVVLPEASVSFVSSGRPCVRLDSREWGIDGSSQARFEGDLRRVFEEHLMDLVDDLHTVRLLDLYQPQLGSLIQRCVPGVLTLTQLTRILRCLLEESVPITQFRAILQALAESAFLPDASVVRREESLLGEARIASAQEIVGGIASEGVVEGFVLDSEVDRVLVKACLGDAPIHSTLADGLSQAARGVRVIVSTRYARRMLFLLLKRRGHRTLVLAPEEFPTDVRFRCIGTLRCEVADVAMAA